MSNISGIKADQMICELADVLQKSFLTVAEEFNLTKQNAPTNQAFVTPESLKAAINNGLKMFGFMENDKIIGCIGIKASKDSSIFYIERLAVLPECRHKGTGARLLKHAFQEIKNIEGKKASIGIINENVRLKKWYITGSCARACCGFFRDAGSAGPGRFNLPVSAALMEIDGETINIPFVNLLDYQI